MTNIHLTKLSEMLKQPATATSFQYGDLKNCISVVETALRGTNWEQALKEATQLCLSCLWIAFMMARHAHPTFPNMADWGVIARMKTPLLCTKCLFEDTKRELGAPRWHASCFTDGQLFHGEGMDEHQVYVKTDTDKWVRVMGMITSPEVKEMLEKRITAEDSQYGTYGSSKSVEKANEIWKSVAMSKF